MLNCVDGAHIAAEVRMLRQAHANSSIIIVEGETDATIMEHFIDSTKCVVEIGFGKENVLVALDQLEDEGFSGVLAIVDADFDRILGVNYTLDSLIVTDAHDFDLTIFASSALNRYLAEHADKATFTSNFGGEIERVRTAILKASIPLAYCRLSSYRRGLRIYFKELKHEQHIYVDSLETDTNGLHQYLLTRSACKCDLPGLRQHIMKEASASHDLLHFCNCHDVAAVLGIALRKILASRHALQTWAREIEAGLRLAFDLEAFSATKMYKLIKQWERHNAPFVVFRSPSV
jgi:hypothetical protein